MARVTRSNARKPLITAGSAHVRFGYDEELRQRTFGIEVSESGVMPSYFVEISSYEMANIVSSWIECVAREMSIVNKVKK